MPARLVMAVPVLVRSAVPVRAWSWSARDGTAASHQQLRAPAAQWSEAKRPPAGKNGRQAAGQGQVGTRRERRSRARAVNGACAGNSRGAEEAQSGGHMAQANETLKVPDHHSRSRRAAGRLGSCRRGGRPFCALFTPLHARFILGRKSPD